MVEALSLNELQNKILERYDHDEQRVVGIMLARYDIGITKEIVDHTLMYFGQDTGHTCLLLRNQQLRRYLSTGEMKSERTLIWKPLSK